MKAFRLDELEAERAANDGAYLQFLRERNMSVGLYALDAGELDPQQPHRQDEVYFVVSGRASITVGNGDDTGRRGAAWCTCRPGWPTSSTTSPRICGSWWSSLRPRAEPGAPAFPRGSVRGGQGLRAPAAAPSRPSIEGRTSSTDPADNEAKR